MGGPAGPDSHVFRILYHAGYCSNIGCLYERMSDGSFQVNVMGTMIIFSALHRQGRVGENGVPDSFHLLPLISPLPVGRDEHCRNYFPINDTLFFGMNLVSLMNFAFRKYLKFIFLTVMQIVLCAYAHPNIMSGRTYLQP